MTDIRCRFCGLTNEEAGLDQCGYNETPDTKGHVFVHPDNPGFKRHPYVQYAASLEALCRACEKCMVLIREGETPDGWRGWFSDDTKRQHWRTCAEGARDVAVAAPIHH